MYTLKDVAERWGKTENDILRMAIAGDVVLSAWWNGVVNLWERFEIDGEELDNFLYAEWYSGLFPLSRHGVSELLACPEPILIHSFKHEGNYAYFASFDESSPEDSPEEHSGPEYPSALAKAVADLKAITGPEYPRAPFEPTLDKIVVALNDLKATEAAHPELVVGVSNNLQKDLPPFEGMKDDVETPLPLNPSERKTVAKLIFTMAVDCYGYDPNQKKSPIPTEIMEAAAKADIAITEDTIRKWLKKGASLLTPH
jgi:hypothetical protein